jgi:D-tyrosyl-tRNA(Tyr) deacylase
MRAVVQRVTEAEVRVDGEVVGAIGPGLCALVGVTHEDTPDQAVKLASKLFHLRVFVDADGVLKRSLADTGAAALVVSQFTLYGDTSRGRRPSWVAAARPEHAEPLVDAVVRELRRLGAEVATGRFRADMRLALVNDGPVTLVLDV